MKTQKPRIERCQIAQAPLLMLVFAIPLGVYLLTLPPGLTWANHGADGGDLITAAYTLGIPHPPGYPAYVSLAWLFTRLPLGSVAWRVSLLSSIATASAAALIFWLVLHLRSESSEKSAVIAGVGAGWSYAFAPLVWGQALVAEVYPLTGFCTVLLLLVALLFVRKQDRSFSGTEPGTGDLRGGTRVAFFLGLVWSVGLGVHPVLLCLAPVVVGMVATNAFRKWRLVTTGFLLGLLLWLYLPLRAGRGGFTWGEPTNLDGFWWMVSGALYRHYLFALPTSALSERLVAWLQLWGRGLGLTGIGLTIVGVIWLARHRLHWLMVTGPSFALLNLFALGYNTTDSMVYLVPAFVISCTWLGAGLMDLFSWMQGVWRDVGGRRALEVRWLTLLFLVFALATPAWALVRNAAGLDLSGDHEAEEFGRDVMSDAPPEAVLLTTTDRQTFALWYFQQVERLRPDVAVVDESLWGFDWYRAELQRAYPGLLRAQPEVQLSNALTDARPHCRVHRQMIQTRWLDCQRSGTN